MPNRESPEHDEMARLAKLEALRELQGLEGLMQSASPPVTRREHLEGRARLIASVEKMRRPTKVRLYALAAAGTVATLAVVATAATRYWTRTPQDPTRLAPHAQEKAPSAAGIAKGSAAATAPKADTAPEDSGVAESAVTENAVAESAVTESAIAEGTETAAAAKPDKPAAAAIAKVSWRELVGRGDFQRVLREARAAGFGHVLRTRPVSDLRALGDAVRYSGDEDLQARAVYEAIRDRFPASDDARIAAFVLGRLSEEHANRPDDAITWYSTYLREAPAGTFAGDALGRKMVLVARQSGKQEARALAIDYLRRYPHGPYEKPALEIAQPRETKGH
ncbi:tol-pal system YbgF family protein [Pendulispora albinea]|uniref:Uncharacterized protein n=1 Tax=Pendulispora albinea TaxID=2741071 RepID=A0ABZ2MCB2_9BACT